MRPEAVRAVINAAHHGTYDEIDGFAERSPRSRESLQSSPLVMMCNQTAFYEAIENGVSFIQFCQFALGAAIEIGMEKVR